MSRDQSRTVHFENQYYPDFLFYWLALWACYLYAEQVTMAIMLVIKSSYTAASLTISMFIVFLILGSGTVRSLSAMPELIYHLTYIVQPRSVACYWLIHLILSSDWLKISFCTGTVELCSMA